MRSRIFDNSESIEIGRVLDGVMGTLILDKAFNNDVFHAEGKSPVVRDAFISSSNGVMILAKHIFSIASEMLSSPQPLEMDAPNTDASCSMVAS